MGVWEEGRDGGEVVGGGKGSWNGEWWRGKGGSVCRLGKEGAVDEREGVLWGKRHRGVGGKDPGVGEGRKRGEIRATLIRGRGLCAGW